MPPPFRIGVMQLTMEPLDEMLESARVMDGAGMDTIWLAEAYPWWRKHGMEARSSIWCLRHHGYASASQIVSKP